MKQMPFVWACRSVSLFRVSQVVLVQKQAPRGSDGWLTGGTSETGGGGAEWKTRTRMRRQGNQGGAVIHAWRSLQVLPRLVIEARKCP